MLTTFYSVGVLDISRAQVVVAVKKKRFSASLLDSALTISAYMDDEGVVRATAESQAYHQVPITAVFKWTRPPHVGRRWTESSLRYL